MSIEELKREAIERKNKINFEYLKKLSIISMSANIGFAIVQILDFTTDLLPINKVFGICGIVFFIYYIIYTLVRIKEVKDL